MPIYEFECRECGKISEILAGGSRKPACPHCGGEKLEKLLSTFATSGGATEGGDSCCQGGTGGGGHRCCGGCCHAH
ncbi:MAG: zinc ribbon domain-containing protein [Puniceicoccales bacterium]|nr:zinc ribbon domain-containing protein [Puniceicoccales bacterium]